MYSSGHRKVPIPFPLNTLTVRVAFPLLFRRTCVAFVWLVSRVRVGFPLRLRSYCVLQLTLVCESFVNAV